MTEKDIKDFEREIEERQERLNKKAKDIARLSEGDGGSSVNLLASMFGVMGRFNECVTQIATTVPCESVAEAQLQLGLGMVGMLEAAIDEMINRIKAKKRL